MHDLALNLLQQTPYYISTYSLKIILALAILFIGKWATKVFTGLIAKALDYRGIDSAVVGFIRQIIFYGLFAVVIVAALGQLGVQTASFVAVIGAAGLAVGLALQGSLSNFAAGVLLILFRPFRSGDFIEVASVSGVVKDMSIFYTVLITPDNKTITVPNGGLLSGNIVNYSLQTERRIDLDIDVAYTSDIALVKRELLDLVNQEPLTLKDKELLIGVTALGESAIKVTVRPWVNTSDFLLVRSRLLEAIIVRFNQVGIDIPVRYMDIPLYKKALSHVNDDPTHK